MNEIIQNDINSIIINLGDHIYKFDVEPLRYSADHLGLKFNGSWSKYEIAIVWNETNKIINLSACYDFKKKTKKDSTKILQFLKECDIEVAFRKYKRFLNI